MNGKVTYRSTIKDLESLPPRERQSPSQRKLWSEISKELMTRHLEHLIKRREWFAGILMSASMLEFAGKTKLIWQQTNFPRVGVGRINRLDLAATNKKLFENDMIDEPTYEKIDKIRIVRNEAAHDIPYQAAITLENKPNATLEKRIKQTIEIIELLFSTS